MSRIISRSPTPRASVAPDGTVFISFPTPPLPKIVLPGGSSQPGEQSGEGRGEGTGERPGEGVTEARGDGERPGDGVTEARGDGERGGFVRITRKAYQALSPAQRKAYDKAFRDAGRPLPFYQPGR